MREAVMKLVERVKSISLEKKQDKQHSVVEVKHVEASWDMSSNDALRAPIVSGYK